MLEAPEETYASGTELPHEGGAVREPAPAGALRRKAAGAFAVENGARLRNEEADEAEYVPRRGASVLVRLRGSVPRSVAGRVVAGCAGVAVLGGALLGLLAVRRSLLHDDRFAIATSSEIEIQGNEHLTRGQILNVFGADLERNIFKVPLAERRADLERLPWVAHATVMRLLPNHLRIAVTERVPVAFVRQGTQLGLVDAHGVLLDMPAETAGDPHYSFPVLTGLSGEDPLSTRAARMAVYAKFMQDLDSSGEKLSRNLSEVDVSNPEDVKALVASGGMDVLVHFGDEQFLERYRQFEQHLPEWKQQYPKLASADMRYERQVVLEMAAGAGVPVTEGAATAGAAAAAGAAVPAAPVAAKAEAPKAVAPAAAPVHRARVVRARAAKAVAAKPAANAAAARLAWLAKIRAARAANVPNTVPGDPGAAR